MSNKSAESRQDFIHKLKVLLKETDRDKQKALSECNELISIFVKSISTAQENLRNELKKKNIRNHTTPNSDN